MEQHGYAVSTETVEDYIRKDVQPALDMFTKIVGWMDEKNPRKYGADLLIGVRPAETGAPTEFWDACQLFITRMLELYDTIQERQQEVVNTLGLLGTKAQNAMAEYRKQDAAAADHMNGLLRDLDGRR